MSQMHFRVKGEQPVGGVLAAKKGGKIAFLNF
jgi:hypothetical protein